MTGKDFDKQYLNMLLSEHEKAVKFLTEASNDSDAATSAFTLKTLPVTEGHLKKLRRLSYDQSLTSFVAHQAY